MSGPAPKPDDQRRRRNSEPGWVDIRVGAGGVTPALPSGHGLRAEGKRRWGRAWATSVSSQWAVEDFDLVLRLCRAHQDYMRDGGPVSLMSELRQLEDKLGLSPKARRDLRWRLVDDGGEVVEENGERVSAADRVRRLRVVGGQAG